MVSDFGRQESILAQFSGGRFAAARRGPMHIALDEVTLHRIYELRCEGETMAETARQLLIWAVEAQGQQVPPQKRIPRRGLRGWVRRLLWRGGTAYVPNPV